VQLRVAREGDATDIAAIYAPYVEAQVTSFEVQPPSAQEMAMRMATLLPSYPWLVAVAEERVVGYAYAARHRDRHAYQWSVDAGIYLHAGAQRRGIGRRLYAMLFELLRAQGYVNAYAGITLPNDASVGLHEAMGFVPVGVYRKVGYKFGAWHDVGWWQLNLQPWPAEPRTPLPFSQLQSAMDL
jgi:L-amino acid N-acyltransferase YncA